jgi:DNA-binding XRE family transcriptional regulator
MTSNQYRKARLARGTVIDIAPKVGVHPTTINKRERGEIPISREAEFILLSLPVLDKPVPAHTLGRKPGSKTVNRHQ